MKSKNIFSNLRGYAIKHSPELATGFGIGGMIGAIILTAKQTPKALQLIDERKEEMELAQNESLSFVDTVKIVWKPYLPVFVLVTLSSALLISSTRKNLRRNAALAAAYKLCESNYDEFRSKVSNIIGEDKEREIEKSMSNNLKNEGTIIIGDGNVLCIETLSNTYFRSDVLEIKKAENILNHRMIQDMSVSVNDLYDLIGIECTELGDNLTWKLEDGPLSISLDAVLRNDKPCVELRYDRLPR